MSKAEEMFNELGYKKNVSGLKTFSFVYSACFYEKKYTVKVIFFDYFKNYEVIGINVFDKEFIVDVGIDLHLAIHEQMKELGWL